MSGSFWEQENDYDWPGLVSTRKRKVLGTTGILIFLVIRYLHGTSYAIASTAMGTSASSLIPSIRQGAGLGYFSMFMSIAMVIGPA
jgi:MFS family permease